MLSAFTILLPVASAKYVSSLVSQQDDLGGAPAFLGSFAPLLALIAIVICFPTFVGLLEERHDIRAECAGLVRSFRSTNRLNGLRYFDRPRLHNDIRLAVEEFPNAARSMFSSLSGVLQGIISLTGLAAYMLSVNASVALGIALAMSLTLVGSLMAGKVRADAIEAAMPHERYRQYLMFLATSALPAPEVTAFGMRSRLGELLLSELTVQRRKEFCHNRLAAIYQILGYVGTLVILASIVRLLILDDIKNAIDAAELSGLAVALLMSSSAAVTLGSGLGSVLENVAIGRHLVRFESLPHSVSIGGSIRAKTRDPFTVEFVDVWFRYSADRPYVVRGLSGRIEAGSSVAVVGANGSGKTTLMKLIARLYDVDSGQVLINDAPIDEYALDTLRASIAVLFQDYQKYDLSLRDNIRLMDNSIDDLVISNVCAQVGLMLNSGRLSLDMKISRAFGDADFGFDLSGGQWQRVAAARVLVRKSNLVILDEPSASLDPDAEAVFFSELRYHVPDATIITVSHRLSHTSLVDEIWVMDDGQVVERGHHSDLLALGGHYARMFELQGHSGVT